jgi:7,8-dihydroneopterin aldolase/epimerase/oxygenase
MTIAVPISLIMKIFLEEIKVLAHHGWYEEERANGHWFCISVEVECDEKKILNDDLANTLNYELIYEIVLAEMKTTQNLLETVAQNILDKVFSFSNVMNAKIKVSKLEPYKMPGVNRVAIEVSAKR